MLTRSRRIALGLLVVALTGGMLPSSATHAQGAARPLMTMGRRISNPVRRSQGAVQPVETVAATETITPAPTDTATSPVTLTSTDTPTATPALAPTETPTPTATLSPTPTPVPPTDTATPLPPPTATPSPPPTSPPQPLPLFPSTPTHPVVPPPVPSRPTATPTPQAHRQRRPAKNHHRQAQHKARHPSTHHVVLNHLRLWARPPVVSVHGTVTVGVQANTGGVHLYLVARYGVGREETRHGTAPHRGVALIRLHVPTVAPCTGRLVARVYVTVASGPRAMTGAVTFLVQCPGTKATMSPSKPRVRLR